MDGMEDLSAVFSQLGSYSPLMATNLSGTCLATRLLQVPYLSLSQVTVHRKVMSEADRDLDDDTAKSWGAFDAMDYRIEHNLKKQAILALDLQQGRARSGVRPNLA
jgi:hypothetical protein